MTVSTAKCFPLRKSGVIQNQTWAVILAAGFGTRLQKITGHAGINPVPKQYCSLYGGASLLRLALARAYAVVPHDRVLCVVAEEHQKWWHRELDNLPDANVIVQPRNRGTAVGTLLPLLVVRARDPSSRLVFLPADHYVADESVFTKAISDAFQVLEKQADRVILLGLEPDEPDTALGYITSSCDSSGPVRSVSRFVEKPSRYEAKKLIRDGALLNSFVFAAQCESMLAMFRDRIPAVVGEFSPLLDDPMGDRDRLLEIYKNLASVDLSRAVFEGAVQRLALLPVPACGWADLGTPERVLRCLVDQAQPMATTRITYPRRLKHVDLASACLSACRPAQIT